MPTPTQYLFTQEVDSSVALTNTIAAAALSTPLSYINTSGSGPTMQVCLMFSDALSSGDQSTLTTLMANYVNPTAANPMPYMISSITTAIQNPTNLNTVLTAKVIMTLPTLSPIQLQVIMTLLGLS